MPSGTLKDSDRAGSDRKYIETKETVHVEPGQEKELDRQAQVSSGLFQTSGLPAAEASGVSEAKGSTTLSEATEKTLVGGGPGSDCGNA